MGGACYGMAITIALNKKKQINVRKYTKSNGDGYQLNKVEIPLKNKKVGDIINYYYPSQVGMSQDEPYYTYNNKEGLKNLVKNAKNGMLLNAMIAVMIRQIDMFLLVKNTIKLKFKDGRKTILLKVSIVH